MNKWASFWALFAGTAENSDLNYGISLEQGEYKTLTDFGQKNINCVPTVPNTKNTRKV